MKQRYELEDRNGRYINAVYDKEVGLFTFTFYMNIQAQTPEDVQDIFNKLGFTKLSETEYKEPKVIEFKKKG